VPTVLDNYARAKLIAAIDKNTEQPVLFPVHPRTRKNFEALASKPVHIVPCDPMGYLEFIYMIKNASSVITDSGGIQEETTVLGVPCLPLRDNTERPATIEYGTNWLAGTRKLTILDAWNQSRTDQRERQIPPFWDGQAASRCHVALRQFLLGKCAAELQTR